MGKKFILNADDFGMTKELNKAVLDGFNNGFLSSASLCANGNAFSAAVNDILPDCQGLGIGVHLNVIEGKPLTNCRLLTGKNGLFDKGYLYFMLNSGKKEFLAELENEFRAQIELVKKYSKPDHIDSHVHIHAIPKIFELVCKLAQEYEIPFIRTQHEKIYTVPVLKKHLTPAYFINIIKILLLNTFTHINKKTLTVFNLSTNDYILGVGYTGMMDSLTVEYGLKNLDEDCIAEALIHPWCFSGKNSHTEEFAVTLDKKLEDKIRRLGFEVTNYKNLNL